ncbi:hypothetical protein UlMin_021508 [Ulmus minor]
MALRYSKILALLILFNLLFFTCVSSKEVPCPPKATPLPPSVPKKQGKCPKDTLKFGICGSWLGLVSEATVLGFVKLKVPIALSLVVNSCGKKVPEDFVCA